MPSEGVTVSLSGAVPMPDVSPDALAAVGTALCTVDRMAAEGTGDDFTLSGEMIGGDCTEDMQQIRSSYMQHDESSMHTNEREAKHTTPTVWEYSADTNAMTAVAAAVGSVPVAFDAIAIAVAGTVAATVEGKGSEGAPTLETAVGAVAVEVTLPFSADDDDGLLSKRVDGVA